MASISCWWPPVKGAVLSELRMGDWVKAARTSSSSRTAVSQRVRLLYSISDPSVGTPVRPFTGRSHVVKLINPPIHRACSLAAHPLPTHDISYEKASVAAE